MSVCACVAKPESESAHGRDCFESETALFSFVGWFIFLFVCDVRGLKEGGSEFTVFCFGILDGECGNRFEKQNPVHKGQLDVHQYVRLPVVFMR